MPHKYVKQQTVKELEDEIATCNSSISRAKLIARQDREGFIALKEQIKDFLETARTKKDNALDLTETDSNGFLLQPNIQEKVAYINRGQERMAETILNMLENSNNMIAYYEYQKKIVEEELAEKRKHEQRPPSNS